MQAQLSKPAVRGQFARPARLNVVAKAAVKAVKAKPASYVCLDCGYLYDGKVAFDTLPGSYECPVCNAKKNRFRPMDNPLGRSNDSKSLQKRREALREQLAEAGEDGTDNSLVLGLVGTTVAIIGAFAYAKINGIV